jgi:phosphate:Na+ symporter
MGFDFVVQILGGLALFLFGLRLLSSGLEKLASSSLQKMLEHLTDNPVKGSLFGAFATALIQSSSLLMVTLIGLLNANLLSLSQVAGIILGMEIGTTMTAQLVSFKVGNLYLHLIALGFFINFLFKKEKIKLVGQAILGLGLLFMGMYLMSSGAKTITSTPNLYEIISGLNENIFLGLFFGIVFTSIVQSSSAVTGLVIALGSAGTITLPFAISLIFGANIGTCITGVLAALSSKLSAKRASAIQVFINVFGVLLFLPFIGQFTSFVSLTAEELPRQIANAHTIFNVVVSLLLLPFIGVIVKAVKVILPGKAESALKNVKYIDDRLLNMIPLALNNAQREVNRLGEITDKMLREATKTVLEGDTGKLKSVLDTEEAVDDITLKIQLYIDKISVRTTNDSDHEVLNTLRNSIIDMERVADLAENIAYAGQELKESNLKIPEEEHRKLSELVDSVLDSYSTSLCCLKSCDLCKANKVLDLEDKVDMIERRMRIEHAKKKGECHPHLHTIYVELLRDLERVGDHANNIADNIIDKK